MAQWYTQTDEGTVLVDGDRGTRTPVPSIPSDAVWIGGVAHPPESAEAHHATEQQYWSDDSRFAPAPIQAPNYVEAPGTFDPFVNEGSGTVDPVAAVSVDYNTDEYADDWGRGPAQGNVTWEFVPDPIEYVDPLTDVDQDNYFLQGHMPQATHTGPAEQPWETGAFVNEPYIGPAQSEWELDESSYGTVTGTSSNWHYGPNETVDELKRNNERHEGEGGNSFFERFVDPLVPGDQDSWSDLTNADEAWRVTETVTGWGENVIESVQEEGLVGGLGLNPGNIFGNIGGAIVPLLIFSMIGDE